MTKVLLVVAGVLAGLLAPGVAHAETPPGCAPAQQIGSTAGGGGVHCSTQPQPR